MYGGTGLATQHWSDKSEAVINTANMWRMLLLEGWGHTSRKNFKITCSEIESEGILKAIAIEIILTLAVHI